MEIAERLYPFVIQDVQPELDAGEYWAKGYIDDAVSVSAQVFREGHEVIAVDLLFRLHGDSTWERIPMKGDWDDRWRGEFLPKHIGFYEFTIEAWSDILASWNKGVIAKLNAGLIELNDLKTGAKLFDEWAALQGNQGYQQHLLNLSALLYSGLNADVEDLIDSLHNDSLLREIAQAQPLKRQCTQYSRILQVFIERKLARFGAWYELFPRSLTSSVERSGTLRDCIQHLPYIKDLGFDVLYLPPIHPIGITNRKGKNNSLTALPDDVGCPWAVGSTQGGHKSIDPQLGNLDDFAALIDSANAIGIEIALDFAIQCSPDHPYVREHPEWFYREVDGTIKYAENPPKKYQDIYPLNFYGEHAVQLWQELFDVVEFWIQRGVKIFRVDNPHTKPLQFWRWLIDCIKRKYPEVIFLAEAFTKPSVKYYLAKAGFTQSYTYFTWRNTKSELIEYLTELTNPPVSHYMLGNLFANTPDILHEFLQRGGIAAFAIRSVLAATLSSSYGIYSGFEFIENTPLHKGSEEYLDSEKYQLQPRDWNAQPNIKHLIRKLNYIRNQNEALHSYTNLKFIHNSNENILCYYKQSRCKQNTVVVVVNLDPFNVQEDSFELPLERLRLPFKETYSMLDLLSGEVYHWKCSSNYVRLDPAQAPAHIFMLQI